MLIGSYPYGVDPKGRVFIPAKWRDDLGASVILMHGILGSDELTCLFGKSEKGWREFAARFSALPVTDAPAQQFRSILFANAAECEMDKQGRILIPAPLREHAGLKDNAVLVGADDRIEIWDPDSWKKFNDSYRGSYQEARRRLMEIGV